MHNKSNILKQFNVILCSPSHAGNIGSTARAMKTMGLENLYLVNPKSFPSDQAYALAAGADDILDKAIIFSNLEEAIKNSHLSVGFTARKRELSQPHLNIRKTATDLIIKAETQTISLLFGNETNGLSNDEIKYCQLISYIDTDKNYSSLNLAQSVQVCCHELRMAIKNKSANPLSINKTKIFVTQSQLNGFFLHFEEVLHNINFLKKVNGERLMQRIRMVFNRTQLDKEEINIMRGILKEIQKKIK